MITHLRRYLRAAPAQGRISVPAALLVLGVALSCSTACITSAVIQSAQADQRYHEPRGAAHRQLERNVLAGADGGFRPPVSEDPTTIRQALQTALPVRPSGRPGTDPDLVEVTVSTTAEGRGLYLITATGDFGSFYDNAFMEYADSLRTRLVTRPVFRIKLIRLVNGTPRLVREQELK